MKQKIKFRVYDSRTGKPQVVMLNTVEIGNKAGCFSTLPDNLIVCQSTNLLDKNGIEIYDGDKVSNSDSMYKRSNVHYSVNHGAWFAGSTRLNRQYVNSCEVIGNIYEIMPLTPTRTQQKEIKP